MITQPLLERATKVIVPPIKCQGIKTKLVPFIKENIAWDKPRGRWIEPFLGSGVVAFNVQPERAVLSDTNQHVIGFYKALQDRSITPQIIRDYLEDAHGKLSDGGANYYYEVRSRFNLEHDPLDFLFLNRACFNGVMRFNKSGGFNVPYNHKPERFAKAYITKIVNQVKAISSIIWGRDYEFLVNDWRQPLATAQPGDFVYLDPPYVGRHTDYFNGWSMEDADQLVGSIKKLPCHFAYSMWVENTYRKNDHLLDGFKGYTLKTMSHFYHVGSKEELRNEMIEGLVLG